MNFSLSCRTCLEYKNAEVYVNVTEKCHVKHSVKDTIIMLVPQMAETLLDTDFICGNCFKVLNNTTMFIEKCLQVEERLKKISRVGNVKVAPAPSMQKSGIDIVSDPLDLEALSSPEDCLVTNEDTQENYTKEEHNYCTDGSNTNTFMFPDSIREHNRIISLENSNEVIIQGFINKLEKSGINILQITKLPSPNAAMNSTKKRILLLGSHILNKDYKCSKCPKWLQSQKKYSQHILNCKGRSRKRDEDEQLMKCQFCERSIKKKHMELHLMKHQQRDEQKRSKLALAKEKKENEKQLLQCRTCFERFTSGEDYKIHLEIHPPYICDKCGKGFIQSTSLTAHKEIHNDPNSYICEICGKGFKNSGMLRVHLQNHENNKFKCHICSKVFKLKHRVRRHIKYVHNTGFTSQCTQCGKLFKNHKNQESHVRLVHLKMKPFSCQICDKKFGRSDYLQRHIAKHTGEPEKPRRKRLNIRRYDSNNKPLQLQCKFCGKWYLGVPKLKLHLETHIKIRRFPCQFCPLTFAKKQICKKHELLHKDQENFFRCNICWRRLASKGELDAHIEAKHKNPRYECDTCGKRFHRMFLLNHHNLLEHRTLEDTEKAKQIVYESLIEITAAQPEVI